MKKGDIWTKLHFSLFLLFSRREYERERKKERKGESEEELHEFFKQKKREKINHTFRFVTMKSNLLFHTLCRWESGIKNSRERRKERRGEK